MKTWLVVLVLLLAVVSTASAMEIIHVDADASAGGNGLSWSTAFKYLQDGLAAASYGDEIRVAQGLYRPDENSANPSGTGNRQATFQLISGVVLKGGYAGPGQPDPDLWDVEAYKTTLRGDLGGGKNSYHVTVGSETDPNTVLDGFTITNGKADGSFPNNCGGGMYNYPDGNLTVTNCTFRGNSANSGAGMYNRDNSSPTTMTNCTFSSNDGCGMDNNHSDLILTNCTFSWNNDGGINNNYSDLTLMNCRFSNNSVDYYGGGIYSHGGSQTLINCTFTGNMSLNEFYGGGGMWVGHMCDCVLINCIFWGNTAVASGPQISIDGGFLSVSYCNVQGGEIDIGGYGGINWLDGNIGEDLVNDDPLFADDDEDDYHHLRSQAGRWDSINKAWVIDGVTSPCIDAGNPGCPLRDEPVGSDNVRINMGAYGGTVEASKTPANWASLADLTNDHHVDISDLVVFVRYWLDDGQCIPGDLNRNEYVNFADFTVFANNWLWVK